MTGVGILFDFFHGPELCTKKLFLGGGGMLTEKVSGQGDHNRPK